MMAFAVKEIFYSLQGEGHERGRAAVFCRFAGCNLWSGRELERPEAQCRFCDTDFTSQASSGGTFADAEALAEAICACFPKTARELQMASGAQSYRPYTILTGGEPALQVTEALVMALKSRGLTVGIESNGTLPLACGLDWICISPKAGTRLVQRKGNELKLVWPQAGLDPLELESLDFEYFYLQPLYSADPTARETALRQCLAFCLARPLWRLSLQSHKYLGIP